MKDLLKEKCGLCSSLDKVRLLSEKYRIPIKKEKILSCHNTWVISREMIHPIGTHVLMKMEKQNKVIFFEKTIENYLFEYALRESQLIIKKTDYKTYLEVTKALDTIGVISIKDEDYFNRAYAFYVSYNELKPINEFGVKNIISICNGISMKMDEVLEKLNKLIEDKYKLPNKVIKSATLVISSYEDEKKWKEFLKTYFPNHYAIKLLDQDLVVEPSHPWPRPHKRIAVGLTGFGHLPKFIFYGAPELYVPVKDFYEFKKTDIYRDIVLRGPMFNEGFDNCVHIKV